jgi:hypothetical protein
MTVKNLPAKFCFITETVRDCEWAIKWLRKQNIENGQIIALSLEAWQYLQMEKFSGALHIWDLLDMEDIIDQAVANSAKVSEELKNFFTEGQRALFVSSVRGRLESEYYQHALVVVEVAKQLGEFFKQQQLTYVALPFQLIFLGPFFPNNQKNLQDNFIFKTVAIEEFRRSGIAVRQSSALTIWKIRFLVFWRWFFILRRIIGDIFDYGRDRLCFKKSLCALLRSVARPVDVLVSGWGRDISRMLSLEKLQQATAANQQFKYLNIVWRPRKIRNSAIVSSQQFQTVVIRETIKKGVSYGPALSLFSLKFWRKYLDFLLFYFQEKHELEAGASNCKKQNLPQSVLSSLFSYRGVFENFFFNLFFAYREGLPTFELLEFLFGKYQPAFFIGSDAAGVSAEMEMLLAKKYQVTTLSTPHGYQAYSMPRHVYMADYILTHCPATAEPIVKIGVSPEKVINIGSDHINRDFPRPLVHQPIRVVIGTRSWGGFWSNYGSRQNVYDYELKHLISGLLKNENCEVVIKSHPNGDYHGYYDLLVKEFNSPYLQHISTGWKLDKFADRCDILVCVGEMPSLYVSAFYLQIPLIFINGVMTKTQARLNYNYQGVGVVVKQGAAAAESVYKLINDPEYFQQVMARQGAGRRQYLMPGLAEENLVCLLNKVSKL